MIGKETRGGSRPGCGRKPVHPGIKRVQTTISVSQETRKRIRILAREKNIRIGRVIDRVVDELYNQHCNEEVRNIWHPCQQGMRSLWGEGGSSSTGSSWKVSRVSWKSICLWKIEPNELSLSQQVVWTICIKILGVGACVRLPFLCNFCHIVVQKLSSKNPLILTFRHKSFAIRHIEEWLASPDASHSQF